jgi:alkylation response protein AidB-like acyl-CoA dehydrogenase
MTLGSSPDELRRALQLAVGDAPPVPGRGSTVERFRALFDCGATDLELARLAEAHHDAVAIAAELGGATGAGVRPGALYGVWAASGEDPLTVHRIGGGWHVRGTVPWCTGVGVVDRALVTAGSDDGPVLLDVAVSDGSPTSGSATWASPAFAATGTQSLRFDLDLPLTAVLGAPGEYLERPGFWHGAIGVSACWAGGLHGLLHLHLARWRRHDPHALAHLGSAVSWSRAAVDVLVAAAREIDAAPLDRDVAQARARRARHLVERACVAAMADLAVGAGPEPLAFDDAILRRTQQLELYIRQCHGERDVEPLGRHVIDRRDLTGQRLEAGWPTSG